MRRFLFAAVFAALPWIPVSEPTTVLAPSVAVAQDNAPKAPDAPKAPAVDVDINRTERHEVWFANPMVLAMIVGGAVLLVALIAMASRGGGTTIVKER